MSLKLPGFSLLLIVVFLSPWLALISFGAYWLWLNGWLYQGFGILAANSVLVYTLLKWRQSKQKPLFIEPFVIQANANWSDQGKLAFEGLQPIIDRWKSETDIISDTNKLLRISNEVLMTVAKQFHAESKYPVLEFPLPYFLKLIVLVCEDLQHEVLDKIPGSHAITISNLLKLNDVFTVAKNATSLLKVTSWLWNPTGAAMSKARSFVLSQGVTKISDEISSRLLTVYVNKLGYYAIQLYSGQITLDNIVPTEVLTKYSTADIAETLEKKPEPLRILVLGQVSSGKSALINALFGEIKAAESWLPTTANVTPYVLNREGLQDAIILDSAGYGGLLHPNAEADLKNEWAKVDVILLVCNASKAARQADLEQINAIRAYFQQNGERAMPIVFAVATHIDQLRPLREWSPPYNIQQPDNPKAISILNACKAISDELSLPLKNVVPVSLNAAYDVYNIDNDNGLIHLITENLNEIQRVRFLRCLVDRSGKQSSIQLRKQFKNLARSLSSSS